MHNLIPYLQSHKKLVLLMAIIAIVAISVLGVASTVSTRPSSPPTRLLPTITPFTSQDRFLVIHTFPANGQAEVYPGEIEISFTTDTAIVAEENFSLTISPTLPHYWKFTNTYPATTIRAQVYGGLIPGAQYLIAVKDKKGQTIYSWTFTTATQKPESASRLAVEEDNQVIQKYYPLFHFIPYDSATFSITYTDHLTLLVLVKDKNVGQVKKEVVDWIKSKGVDPATHTIRYVNGFTNQ